MLKQARDDQQAVVQAQIEYQRLEVERQRLEEDHALRNAQCQEHYKTVDLLARNSRTLEQAWIEWKQFVNDHPGWQSVVGGDPAQLAQKMSINSPIFAIMLDPKRSPAERAKAGDDINQYGDPRPGVIDFNFDADYWCDVPAGEFTMGSEAYDDQNPIRTVNLPAFRIAKYPITYAQYRTFLDDPNGYRAPQNASGGIRSAFKRLVGGIEEKPTAQWWKGLHADGLAQQREGPGDQSWKLANRPAENVSWYDAMAFCTWLSAKLGYEITLPTEQQWEKAARGTDERTYPYGNEFDAANGNTHETGIGQTSAVGIFPDGVSPYGVMDMLGNVLEWTLTEYDSRISNRFSSNNTRALRGGSCFTPRNPARSASRYHYDPAVRSSSRPLRVSVGVGVPSLLTPLSSVPSDL